MWNALLNHDVQTLLPLVLVTLIVIFVGLIFVIKTVFKGWRSLVDGVTSEVQAAMLPLMETTIRNAMRERANDQERRHSEVQAGLDKVQRSLRLAKKRMSGVEGRVETKLQAMEKRIIGSKAP